VGPLSTQRPYDEERPWCLRGLRGVKDPDAAIDFRPPPRTEPLLDLESDLDDLLGLNPRYLIGIVLGVLLLFAALVLGVR